LLQTTFHRLIHL